MFSRSRGVLRADIEANIGNICPGRARGIRLINNIIIYIYLQKQYIIHMRVGRDRPHRKYSGQGYSFVK